MVFVDIGPFVVNGKEGTRDGPFHVAGRIIPSGGWVVLGTFLSYRIERSVHRSFWVDAWSSLPVRYGHGWQVAAARSPPHQKRILIDGSHV